MESNSYFFDPCSVDGSDKEDEVGLDNWKPKAQEKHVPKSEWRQQQINGNYNQQPGLDELKKIHMYLKKDYPDHEIMDSFGISCETLVAIKRGCYSPVEGISLDNQSKIYKEFTRTEKRLDRLFKALNFLVENDKERLAKFADLLAGKELAKQPLADKGVKAKEEKAKLPEKVKAGKKSGPKK